MDNRYGTELDLNIGKFKGKLKEASQQAGMFGRTLNKQLNVSMDTKNLITSWKQLSRAGVDFSNAALNVETKLYEQGTAIRNLNTYNNSLSKSYKVVSRDAEQAAVSMVKTSNNVKITGKNAKGLGNDLQSAFKGGLNSIKRLTLGVLGVRSTFALFRQQMNLYRQENAEFDAQMSLTSSILMQTLAPAFEFIGDIIQYAMITFAKLIEIMFGVNILSNVFANNLGKANKAMGDLNGETKELNDNLTGLDEITNLQKDSGGLGTGLADKLGGVQAQFNALEEFKKKWDAVNKWFDSHPGVVKFFENLGKVIKGIGKFIIEHPWETLLGIGAFTLLKTTLPMILGVVGGSTGLYGILGVLGLIASAGIISIVFNVGGIRDKLNEIDWEELGKEAGTKISKFILSIDWIGTGKTIIKSISGGITAAYTTIETAIDGLINKLWESTIGKLMKKIDKDVPGVAKKGSDIISKMFNFTVKFSVNQQWGISSLVTNAINSFKKAGGGIFDGSWHPITAYAGGGLPSTGEMFVAREAGPEMVGTISGHTAVMNNDQIVASVAAGVAQAVASVMGGNDRPIVLNINGKEFAKATYSDYQNEGSRRGANTSIRRY